MTLLGDTELNRVVLFSTSSAVFRHNLAYLLLHLLIVFFSYNCPFSFALSAIRLAPAQHRQIANYDGLRLNNNIHSRHNLSLVHGPNSHISCLDVLIPFPLSLLTYSQGRRVFVSPLLHAHLNLTITST